MREIRRLNAEELPSYHRIKSVVYNRRWDFSSDKKYPSFHPAQWCWGVFENGRLVSAMTELEFLMRFDGQNVPMSGIGGVGTLPDARKAGLVRSMFECFLAEAFEKGVIFSNLNPFSHAFYRKFGYEVACARNQVTIPTREFAHLKLQGKFTHVFPNDDYTALNEVHNKYIADLNHGVCREYWPDNRSWKIINQDDPYAKGVFLYLWQDDTGQNRGYIQYEDIIENNEHIMFVWELEFTDRDALYGVLSIVSGLEAQFKKFRWFMPTFLDPSDFIDEARELEQKVLLRDDMTRIINVKVALEKMRRPAGEGAYIIQVEDELIPANRGKYLVEYGPEGSRVSVTKKEADILCDIPSLSQLVTGYRTLENALRTRKEGLYVTQNRETLDKVFTLRPQHLTEYF